MERRVVEVKRGNKMTTIAIADTIKKYENCGWKFVRTLDEYTGYVGNPYLVFEK